MAIDKEFGAERELALSRAGMGSTRGLPHWDSLPHHSSQGQLDWCLGPPVRERDSLTGRDKTDTAEGGREFLREFDL